VYFHDVPAEVHAEALTRGEPEQSWTPMTQAWPLSAWPDVPTRVLIGRDDRLFPAEFQRRISPRAPGNRCRGGRGRSPRRLEPPG
jgi:hypothetical protein